MDMTDEWTGWMHRASRRKDPGSNPRYRCGAWCGCGFTDGNGLGYGEWGAFDRDYSETKCYGRGSFWGSGTKYGTGRGGGQGV